MDISKVLIVGPFADYIKVLITRRQVHFNPRKLLESYKSLSFLEI